MEKNKILVSGLVNMESSVSIDSFPINYSAIEYPFFGVSSCVSGVGFNIAKALKALGSNVDLLSEVGSDLNGEIIRKEIKQLGINPRYCYTYIGYQTAESVVLVDKQGKRKIYCDLKDIQDRTPLNENAINLNNYSLAVLTNINFNRDLLKAAKQRNIVIASDVHVLNSISDIYNEDFMKYSDILFLSNEAILGKEGEFLRDIYQKYHNDIIVCGCGHEGALMYVGKEDKYYYEPAKAPLGVKNTVGAGDALFSAFVHFYNKGIEIEKCLKKAVLFAGLKISQSGGSNGFASEDQLAQFE